MTPDHFQLDDIKNPFWREFVQETEGMTPLESYCWVCDNIHRFSKERRNTVPVDPLRAMNNRLFLEGKTMLPLSERQLRNIRKQAPNCSTENN